jgi:spore coat polysaccharide biosynthesis protein SpsF
MIVAIVQARMGSGRLPGKVLADVMGEPLLAHVVARANAVDGVHRVVVATSSDAGDDPIAALCDALAWECFRGSENDVLDRFVQAARHYGASHVLRITADCPFVSPQEADKVIAHHLALGADYTHNLTVWGSGLPLGVGSEIFTCALLERSWREGLLAHHREHVDEFAYERREELRFERVLAPAHLHRPELRLTVDTAVDLDLTRRVYAELHNPPALVDVAAVVELLDRRPELGTLNRDVEQRRL